MFQQEIRREFFCEFRKETAEIKVAAMNSPVDFPKSDLRFRRPFETLCPVGSLLFGGERLLPAFALGLCGDPETESAPSPPLQSPVDLFQALRRCSLKARKAGLVRNAGTETRKMFVRMRIVRNIPAVVENEEEIGTAFGEVIRPAALAEETLLVQIVSSELCSLIAEKTGGFVFLLDAVLSAPGAPVVR